MRCITGILTLFLIPGLAFSANVFIVDDAGNITAAGGMTHGSALEVNANVVLANDETIDNATDAEVRITFFDDAEVLGTLVLESDNPGTWNDDSFFIDFNAKNAGGTIKTFARIDAELDDVTTVQEDGTFKFSVLDENVMITPLIVNEFGLTLENGEILDNSANNQMRVIFNDDTTNLVRFSIEAATTVETEVNNVIDLEFVAADSGSARTEYGTVRVNLDDKTGGEEDGSMQLIVIKGGTETIVGEFDATGAIITGAVDANNLTVDAGAGLDNQATGALVLGAENATSVEIADSGVPTDIQGPVTVLGGIDTAGSAALILGASNASSVEISDATILTDIQGPLSVNEAATLDTTLDVAGVATGRRAISLNTAETVTCTADGVDATGVKGNIHFNDDNDAIKFILPPVAAGYVVSFANTDVASTSIITIEIDDLDKISLNGLLLDAGITIDSDAEAGASITLIGVDAVRWITLDRVGTWAAGGSS